MDHRRLPFTKGRRFFCQISSLNATIKSWHSIFIMHFSENVSDYSRSEISLPATGMIPF
jgi:hypothetical protein